MDLQLFNRLPPDEQRVALLLLSSCVDAGESIESLIQRLEFKQPVVSLDQFVDDPHYLGKSFDPQYGESFWPYWREALEYIIKCEEDEIILTGAIGIGKSIAAAVYLAWLSYTLLNMRNLLQVLGKAVMSDVNLVFFNITQELAEDRKSVV